MSFWNPINLDEAARLKRRYEELGSLQALAEEENVRTAWLGQVLLRYDRRVAGSDTGYAGPERRKAKS